MSERTEKLVVEVTLHNEARWLDREQFRRWVEVAARMSIPQHTRGHVPFIVCQWETKDPTQ